MRLSAYTDFSLRVLIYLAVSGARRATIDDIADAYRISRNHLMKVVHGLGRSGHIHTTRGRSGGLALARPADDINIGEVVRECEGESPLVECFSKDNNCTITDACVLRTALADANEAFYSTLDRYTLADLARPGHALSRLLGVDSQEAENTRSGTS